MSYPSAALVLCFLFYANLVFSWQGIVTVNKEVSTWGQCANHPLFLSYDERPSLKLAVSSFPLSLFHTMQDNKIFKAVQQWILVVFHFQLHFY